MNIGIIRFILALIKGYSLLSFLLLEEWLTHLIGGRNLYQKQQHFLVRRAGLFDPAYYLETNPDVAEKNTNVWNHYVKYGDREGRYPMPFFDPQYYRSQIKTPFTTSNTLLHYAYIGRYLRLSPSPWFDVAYYLKENKDVARSKIDPLLHYLKWGGAEGRSPSIQFDGSYYLRSNPDVAAARINPLLHYLRIGRFENRPTKALHQLPVKKNYKKNENKNKQPSALLKRRAVSEAKIDVIVPVYKDKQLTLQTIYSVLKAKVEISFELIVINDCSPEPGLAASLNNLHRKKLLTLLNNPENRGFVYSVNQGMQLHPTRDVVLLNADTEVFDHWLDKLYAAAYRHPKTGSVTPLSNNASICSYPCFLNDNPYPLELDYAQLDNLAARVNQTVEIETPTGVGFCMYIRRDCLNAVGLFDEASFGQGYGEENDFCQRAIVKDWRNIITTDTFVRHWGSASFQGEKAERVTAALKVLDYLHPNYRMQVDNFIKQDPLATSRERLDWARIKQQVKSQNVLIVCHNRGGGAERHVQEDTQHLLQKGIGVFYLRPVQGKPTHVRLAHPKCSQLYNLQPYFLSDTDSLVSALSELKITRIHTHGLVDFTSNAPEHILKLTQLLKAEFWVDLHDYKVICPRINLTNRAGRYCGEPDETSCNQCCATEGNDFGATDIKIWREVHHSILTHANKIFVPSHDMQIRLSRYFPKTPLSVSPHEEITIRKLVPPQLNSDNKLRITVIGSIGKAKGYDIFRACAFDAKKRKLPLEFSLLGYSLQDEKLEQSGVKITGRYLEHEALIKLKELAPHVVWLPSTWPETYSYTLSLALNGGYPTFAFDIGAIAMRLRSIGQEHCLMPLQMLDSPSSINDIFVSYLSNCQSNHFNV